MKKNKQPEYKPQQGAPQPYSQVKRYTGFIQLKILVYSLNTLLQLEISKLEHDFCW